jgi:putative sporulation protein YtaF
MTSWLIILFFAASSSIDNLGVGICYGIRNIRVNLLSNLVIATICFLFSEFGIWFGGWLSSILPGILPIIVAAFLLFIIGIRIILLASPRNSSQCNEKITQLPPRNQSIKRILQNPELVDADRSGEIGLGEAIILGIALSANALTNGLSAGLMGLSPHAISITAAIGSFLAVRAGISLGHRVANIRIGSFTLGEFSTVLSGVLLIAISVHTLLS